MHGIWVDVSSVSWKLVETFGGVDGLSVGGGAALAAYFAEGLS